MTIIVNINKFNKITIDPNISINSGNSEAYTFKFIFDEPWKEDIKLYAVFKPSMDIPVSMELNPLNEVVLPRLVLRRFQKLSVGVKGVKDYITVINTNYCRIPVDIGAI